ncbi:MAG TPA: FtsX-like permease family protein [Acidimicrobiia bacterium]
MRTVFGIPAAPLATGLVVALGVVLAVVAALAVRNRVFLKLGVRNVRRGRGRTVLIVVGLMLGTAIIASALGTGDTMSRTVRSAVFESLGETDELITVQGPDTEALLTGTAVEIEYFDETLAATVTERIPESAPVDAVAPAIIEPIAVQDRTSRENEPRVTLFASDPVAFAAFDPIRADGREVSLADLAPGQVYLNRDAAEDLGAAAGDALLLLVGTNLGEAEVAAVVDARGTGTEGAAVLMPLGAAQELLGRPGEVKHVLVSNDGDEASGAARTGEVVAALDPVLAPLGLEALPMKEDGLDLADENGQAFMSIFTTFGTFSIAAGILLIFLIFVMLAAERRGEMGTARAIGTQRGHLVQTFLFEGFAYDLLAAAVGTALGVGIAYVMVLVMSSAFGDLLGGIELQHDTRPRSLLIAYGLGVLVTFLVVAASAWRVSRLNIVTAIRNAPEPVSRRPGRGRWVWMSLLALAGAAMTASGAAGAEGTAFLLGVSLLLIAVVLVARALGASERLVFTAGGIALVVWWLLPSGVHEAIVGKELSSDFSIFITAGLVVVVGATWTVMYNADVVIRVVSRGLAWLRGLAPVLKTALAYPLRTRFRTGITLAMFTLVVFTLVIGSTVSTSFIQAFDDEETFGGGFDIRTEMAPLGAVDDMATAVEENDAVDAADFEVIGAQSFVPVDARQTGADGTRPAAEYFVRGLDDAFLDHTTYGLSAIATGYDSADDVWRALATTDGLAVVDGFVAPRRGNFNFGTTPDFRLEGFFVEDEIFEPVPVEVTDPQTGAAIELSVIGVLSDNVPWEMSGITTSQDTLAPFGARARANVHFFAVAPGVDADAAAKELESAFLGNGMEAETMAALLDEAVGTSWMFNRLIQGFLGLGLIVGVAALAVVSARSVVERRQQIGVLRAIGFQRAMVRRTFVIEASFVALTAIVLGTTLGLMLAWNLVRDAQGQPGNENLAFVVPWVNLLVVFAAVYGAALIATSLPARKAARVYPAEALRYE